MAGVLVLVVILSAVLLCIFGVVRCLRLRRTGSDQDWLPAELRDAELLWSERAFRSDGPVPIAVRIDRAYRAAGGDLVLIEFKRRARCRVHLSDVVELSAQRYALQHVGHVVSRHAYVVVVLPDGTFGRSLPVDLEDAARIELRAARLVALIERRRSPRGASHPAVCASCGHRGSCLLALR
jgi:CRISPR-associated exonuclease Cas4